MWQGFFMGMRTERASLEPRGRHWLPTWSALRVIQYCIAVASGTAVRMIAGRDYVSETMVMRLAGAGMALVAAVAFVNIALVG